MAILQFILLALIPYLIQAGNRCGTTWADAAGKCGTTCVDTDAVCPTNEHCYASLSDTPCSSTTPPPPNTGRRTLTLKDLQSFMGRPTGTDLSGWLNAVNQALAKYDLNTDKRIIGFLSQVRHETASMTIFYQPADFGGGFVHMTPSNWKACCLGVPEVAQAFNQKYGSCLDCSCIDNIINDAAKKADASKSIFSQPIVAAYSAGWWFQKGAIAAFGWKGCTQDLKYYADQGKGGVGSSDCTHSGNAQLTCCIFWTVNEASGSGLTQRNQYYDQAVAYATSAWGYSAAQAEEITEFRSNPGLNAGIAIGCIVGIVAIVIVVVALYLKRKQRLQSEVV